MSLRCIVCGKALEPQDKAVMFRKGRVQDELTLTDDDQLIGFSHQLCFESSVNSPTMVLNRIKKLAKPPKVKAQAK
jgi:hypothetical protein